ncbi:hypothetical protein FDP08_07745 [Marinobacter panjinensis]|uniref:Lipoprotein n=1 Tax=Marinobacter panjinensis TaxID=2576384 RepID=A0A4U6R510_9GAMM|nr:hypothetical protein [Marinobacter panjinensis]MCR8913332.1 hypothetical protein [Marinobacter panjinensis]TKV67998.1 hypothetical protein FDP08_07745 [Marinobacter panjinensis]
MNKQKLSGRFIVVSSLALLAACGGGGGGEGGGSAEPTLSLDSSNYANKKIEISSSTNVDNINQLSTDMNDAFGLLGDLHESLWDQSGGESGTTNCDGGGTANVTYAGKDWNVDESWEFNDCIVSTYSHGDVLLNGTFRYVDTLTGETATSESWKGYESYNIIGELKDSGEPLNVKGRSDWDQLLRWDNDTKSGRSVDTIEAFELKVGNRYVALTNIETRLEGTEFGAEFTMDGTLIGSAIEGYVQISTPTPVSISVNETCPTEGIFRISSDGSAEVRYGSSAAGTAGAVAVWIDGQIVESYEDCNDVGFAPVY